MDCGRVRTRLRAIHFGRSFQNATHGLLGRQRSVVVQDEVGREGVAALRALKGELDPAGIMNPGKLLP